jgi:hypothetical protein
LTDRAVGVVPEMRDDEVEPLGHEARVDVGDDEPAVRLVLRPGRLHLEADRGGRERPAKVAGCGLERVAGELVADGGLGDLDDRGGHAAHLSSRSSGRKSSQPQAAVRQMPNFSATGERLDL